MHILNEAIRLICQICGKGIHDSVSTPAPHSNQASEIGLVDGGNYPVALFHALRHPPKSQLVFYTTVNTLTSAVLPGNTCPSQ
jgi:hypothetical protein